MGRGAAFAGKGRRAGARLSLTGQEITALGLTEHLAATPKNIDRVAQSVGPEIARWAFLQWELRRRAVPKFSRASEMLFVREALEQASHEAIASYHASQFPRGASVVDFTTGIGGDLMAFAARGQAVGYELDPERARYAEHNASLAGRTVVTNQSGLDKLEAGVEFAFVDPARRVEGRRTLRMEDFSPAISAVSPGLRKARLGGLKLSPLLSDTDLESLGGTLEFVSHRRECREALVWLGDDVASGRWAVLSNGDRLPSGEPVLTTNTPGAWIAEADPAAIRAHALGALAETLGGIGLGESNGFLTADDRPESPWVRWFEVLAQTALDDKQLRATLRTLDAKVVAVKPRGFRLDPAEWEKRIRTDGTQPVEVLVFPVAGRPVAVVCRRKT